MVELVEDLALLGGPFSGSSDDSGGKCTEETDAEWFTTMVLLRDSRNIARSC